MFNVSKNYNNIEKFKVQEMCKYFEFAYAELHIYPDADC